jgi:hypothetical protein
VEPSRPIVALVALAVALACGLARISPAHAQAKRSLVVEVSPADWRAEALARTLAADLADDRIAPRAAPSCDGPCADAALRAAGVDLVARATLDAAGAGTLGYELRPLWPGAPAPARGVIALRAIDRAALAGVLRDRLHRLVRTTGEDAGPSDAGPSDAGPSDAGPSDAGAQGSSDAGPDGAGTASMAPHGDGDRDGDRGSGGTPRPAPRDVALALALIVAVLAAPIAMGRVRTRRFLARAAARRTLIAVAALGGVALILAALPPADSRGVWFAAGGIAWGSFVAVTVPVLFPPLIGLGQIDYSELWRLLAGWCGLVVQRAVWLAALYAPVGVLIVLAPSWTDAWIHGGSGTGSDALGVDETAWLALVLPVGLLVTRQVIRLAIAVAAERLDAVLADPTTSAADAADWHAAVRGYLVGYLRRNGLACDDDLLDRVRIVAAGGDEVFVYGGGATAPRIAIPRKMLELALAPWGRPHDYAAPRVSTLHWTQWNAGLVMATEAGTPIATGEQRQPRETTTEGDPSEHAREPLGEPPTLAGVIEPAALDPRKSYRPHDDPAWLDWDVGEDYDGTDAGDRDFLFGLLIHAIARIQRHGDRTSTLARIAAGVVRSRRVAALLAPVVERLTDGIGDDHAAIRGARHHLVQYLAWQAWQREDLLTARAYAPELEAMSRRVLAERAEPSSGTRPGPPHGARARRRLARLAGLAHLAHLAHQAHLAHPARRSGSVHGEPAPRMRWRNLALVGAIAAGAGLAAIAIIDAVRYHATYSERSSTNDREKPHGKN